MGLDIRKLKLVLFPLIAWFVLLALTGCFARWQWTYQSGVEVFSIWWIAVLSFVASSLAILLVWRKNGRIGYSQWLWFVGPFLCSLWLTWKIGTILKAIAGTPEVSMLYAVYSSLFIINVLVWIVGFPYEEILGPYSKKSRVIWRTILAIAAAGIGGLAFQHGVSLARVSLGPFDSIGILQLWMRRVTAVVYIFLVVRLLLPPTVAGFATSFRVEGTAGRPTR